MLKKYKNDIIVISVIIIIALIIFIVTNSFKAEGHTVMVTIDDKVYDEYDLSSDITISLDIGNTLVIKDNEAYVIDSTCEDKICISHGRISSVGETIICLPHKLIIEVKGDSDE